jgi:predicted NUDIX family NTP pyrophosphohydrolase
MPIPSAGLLAFRRHAGGVEVVLVHRGAAAETGRGGAWAIPSVGLRSGEEPLAAAKRAFAQLNGVPAPSGPLLTLGAVKQHHHRIIQVWACEIPAAEARGAMQGSAGAEQPAGTRLTAKDRGATSQLGAVQRHGVFPLDAARSAIVRGQRRFLDELEYLLAAGAVAPPS